MMKKTLFLLLLPTVLIADQTLGPIHYSLPKSAQFWGSTTYEPSTGPTIIYSPSYTNADGRAEDFSVSYFNSKTDLTDLELLEKQLKILFPSMETKIHILQYDNKEILYEWTGKDHGKETVYGISRIVAMPDDHTLKVMYTSYKSQNNDKAKEIWLPIIKAVH